MYLLNAQNLNSVVVVSFVLFLFCFRLFSSSSARRVCQRLRRASFSTSDSLSSDIYKYKR
jgi:hypothetical protein